MDTDSLYSEWGSLLDTIEGVEGMTDRQKLDIVLQINQGFLDGHNCEYIKEYYEARGAKSVHEFELETVGRRGVWLDVKKKYAQLLAFKDGKYYDSDDLPLKLKGLEIVKSSTPELARTLLKKLVRFYLEIENDRNAIHKMNLKMQECWKEFQKADVESISQSVKVNNYVKYVVDDEQSLTVMKGTPSNVKGLANYNYLINKKNIDAEHIYGGKVKIYAIKPKQRSRSKETQYMCFQSRNWQSWLEEYAPIDRRQMFQVNVLDPMNRILEPTGINKLNIDGEIILSLF